MAAFRGLSSAENRPQLRPGCPFNPLGIWPVRCAFRSIFERNLEATECPAMSDTRIVPLATQRSFAARLFESATSAWFPTAF